MPISIHEAAKIAGGRITQVHSNWRPGIDGGVCTCSESAFRVVRVRSPKKARVRG